MMAHRSPIARIGVLLLCSAVLACAFSASAFADTITVTPSSPTTADSITLRVDGVSAVSGSGIITSSVAVAGNAVRLNGCTNSAGFATPSTYVALFSVSGLAAGSYTVQYFHAYCAFDGTIEIPYAQTASQTFAVTATAPMGTAIPTLSNVVLIGLAVALAATGVVSLARRGGDRAAL
jgi:hypothetical protein